MILSRKLLEMDGHITAKNSEIASLNSFAEFLRCFKKSIGSLILRVEMKIWPPKIKELGSRKSTFHAKYQRTKMLSKGMSAEVVSELTGLSEADLQDFKA